MLSVCDVCFQVRCEHTKNVIVGLMEIGKKLEASLKKEHEGKTYGEKLVGALERAGYRPLLVVGVSPADYNFKASWSPAVRKWLKDDPSAKQRLMRALESNLDELIETPLEDLDWRNGDE